MGNDDVESVNARREYIGNVTSQSFTARVLVKPRRAAVLKVREVVVFICVCLTLFP